jgi:uncharacterized protein YjbI with pentapeptide repeats
MANLYNVPLKNAVQKVLANTLTSGETGTITFSTSVSSDLQASSSIPGILVIDRVDVNGNLTPALTEYISFEGVSGSTVTGLARGLGGTSAQGHSIGAIVEFVPDVVWADAINDVFTTEHNADGTHKTLSGISLASVTINNSTLVGINFSGNSLASVNISTSVFDSGTITNASLVSITTVNRAYIPVEQKFISTATSTFDFAFSNIHSITLSAATTTLSFANPVSGQAVIARIGQDGTGGRRVVFPSTIYWAGGTTPTLTSTASKIDSFGLLCTASGYYDGYIVGQNL